ncbi:DUF2520 domain-containing protein [Flavobacterium agricola]|uniref:DUF2520 domain-containing protein n=1 Tax=Flavobacterium agricola TaxID=2870839 RepID=A0ABY6M109_9FLAO|nr:Rossmann-like and DUF2520 domain-containing protein [Flavobacterium agricola]UYW02189.1 DUF2520 domain-containing protein [Flavobacterium agricola]
MITVNIIGSGNVATHLIATILQENEFVIQKVYARRAYMLEGLLSFSKITSRIEELEPADITIISVSDDAIAEVSSQLPYSNQFVVHTSGSSDISVIDSKNNAGVLYPLQTFSKTKKINFKEVPLCIESAKMPNLILLKKVAALLSDKVYIISSEQRRSIHVAAVYASNFVNHMYHLAHDICTEKNIPFEILMPLIQETAQKIKTLSPKDAQTGPAKRQDKKTILSHLEVINQPLQKEIYTLLTNSIIKSNV